jgi:hypothetical protein
VEPDSTARFKKRALVAMKEREKILSSEEKNEPRGSPTLS